ncbi:BrnT family toxin [Vineibacter terrae]|uniref:BrnT family toxin n=1 Tax=Vineibacter terrae TaxID=2586908 RepID=A0A5C8PT41_9HYPH|nr:BrnT family toxin [Vineibacter terrae]
MRFEWDPEKARINAAKHGVSFELARRVWDDPLYTIVADPHRHRRAAMARHWRDQRDRDACRGSYLSGPGRRGSSEDHWRPQGDVA